MRKVIILILVILPFISFSKYYSGIITFNDNTTLKGLIEIPAALQENVHFKLDKDASNMRYSIDEVKGFVIETEENSKLEFVSKYIAHRKLFKKNEVNISKRKYWLRVLKEGKISMYSRYNMYIEGVFVKEKWSYFFQKENAAYAIFLDADVPGDGINKFRSFKKVLAIYFEKDCPKLLEAVKKEDYLKYGSVIIVDLYENLCGK